jgi:hypothetical protein
MSEKTGFAIPPEFWATVSRAEFVKIIDRNGLDRGQCIRVWEMLRRKDEPPASLALFVDFADLQRVVAHMKRAPEGARDGAGSKPKES